MRLDKKEKKDLQAGLAGFIKAGKSNEKKRTSCLSYVLKHQRVQYWNMFTKLHYY